MTHAPGTAIALGGVTREHASDAVLGPVLDVGAGGRRVGTTVAILAAALLHGYMVVRVYSALWGMDAWLHRARKALRADLQRSCRTCADHGCLVDKARQQRSGRSRRGDDVARRQGSMDMDASCHRSAVAP